MSQNWVLRKNIDIDDSLVLKLKVLSAFENTTVKNLMEEAVEYYVAVKEKERMERGDKKQNFNGDDEDDVFL